MFMFTYQCFNASYTLAWLLSFVLTITFRLTQSHEYNSNASRSKRQSQKEISPLLVISFIVNGVSLRCCRYSPASQQQQREEEEMRNNCVYVILSTFEGMCKKFDNSIQFRQVWMDLFLLLYFRISFFFSLQSQQLQFNTLAHTLNTWACTYGVLFKIKWKHTL